MTKELDMKLRVFVHGIDEICTSPSVEVRRNVIDHYAPTNACVHKIIERVSKEADREWKSLGKMRTSPMAIT